MNLKEYYDIWEAELIEEYPPVIKATIKNLRRGLSVPASVDMAFDSTYLLDRVENKTVEATIGASQIGLGAQLTLDMGLADDYYRYTEFVGTMNLSEMIRDGDQQKAVKKIVGEYLQYQGNTRELAKKITKKSTNKAELPKYLNKLIRDAKKSNPLLVSDLSKAKRNIDKLTARGYKDEQLIKAYSKVVKIVESGLTDGLDDAVKRAFNQKVKYLDTRVARTEMSRAYGDSVFRKVHEDKGIIGVRWLLSSAHPRPDICNHYAESDPFGKGAGVYPAENLPSFPAHSNCLCSLISIRANPDDRSKGRFSEERTIDYLKGLSDEKRADVLGSKKVANGAQSEWLPRLEKLGFSVGKDRHMTAKKVIKELQ